MFSKVNHLLTFYFIFILFSCANIVMPTGGEKDIEPPKIQNVIVKNTKNSTTIQFDFDEYLQFNEWEKNFYISPPVNNKSVISIEISIISIEMNDIPKAVERAFLKSI